MSKPSPELVQMFFQVVANNTRDIPELLVVMNKDLNSLGMAILVILEALIRKLDTTSGDSKITLTFEDNRLCLCVSKSGQQAYGDSLAQALTELCCKSDVFSMQH
jgi:hypothetical protein